MSLTLPHPRPIARATGAVHGHHLRIGRSIDGLGYSAQCSCEFWATWKHDRRAAVLSFHRHLRRIRRRAGAPKHLRRAA